MNKNQFNPGTIHQAAKVIYALNHLERIYILNLLYRSIQLRPSDVCIALEMAPNIVAKHLKILIDVGLLKKKAITRKEVYYSLNKNRVSQMHTGVRIISIRNAKEYSEYVRFGTVA